MEVHLPRKKRDLGAKVTRRIEALTRAGGTEASIAKALAAEGAKVSPSTVGRRKRALAGKASKPKAVLAPPPLPSTPDEIPEGTDLDTLDRWLETATRMGKVAEVNGDLAALARAGRLATSLLEAKRKATPPARADPNDSPDMTKLAAQVRERLHKLVDQVVIP